MISSFAIRPIAAMKKFPFTTQGVAAFQEALYRLHDAHLLDESLAVADDALSWTARHFEFDVFMLERMRNLPAAHLRCLGWCLAACVANRLPLQYIDHLNTDYQNTSFSIAIDLSAKHHPGGKSAMDGQLVLTAHSNP